MDLQHIKNVKVIRVEKRDIELWQRSRHSEVISRSITFSPSQSLPFSASL